MDGHLERVASHHGWWSETYDSDYFGNMALYHRITLDNIRRFLSDDTKGVILDAGGGTGIWAIEMAKIGYSVVLTDISQGMLAKAEEKISALRLDKQIEIRVSNICDMPEFSDGLFAMVLCQGDPLSYCGDYQSAVREFVRVVQRSGTVIASVDNRASALNWIRGQGDRGAIEKLLATGDVVMPQERDGPLYMVHAFTPEELRELFESNGLAVERLIGKPVIAHRLGMYKSKDPHIQDWLFELELNHNADPAYHGWGGHLEIVGRKI